MRRSLYAAIVLTLFHFSDSAYSQGQEASGEAETLSPELETKPSLQEREESVDTSASRLAWVMSGYVAPLARAKIDDYELTDFQTFKVGFIFGRQLSRYVDIQAKFTALHAEKQDEHTSDSLFVPTIGPAVTIWPWQKGLYLRPAVGFSSVYASHIDDFPEQEEETDSSYSSGWNASFDAGYAYNVIASLAVSLGVEYAYANYRKTENIDVNPVQDWSANLGVFWWLL